MKRKAKKLALCAILAAMGVVLMTVGVVIEAFDLTTVMLASMLTVIAVIEAGRGYAYMTYGVMSVLSILLLPSKLIGVMFLFLGYYPIVKEQIERLKRPVSWALKLLFFNLSLVLLYVVMKALFTGIELIDDFGIGIVMTYVLAIAIANFAFILYDIVLTKLIALYFHKLRRRLGLGKNR